MDIIPLNAVCKKTDKANTQNIMKKHKKSNGAGSIRQRPDGKWEGRYCSGYNSNGNPIRKSIYGKTEKEVRLKLNKVIAEIEEGTYIKDDKISYVVWLNNWLETYAKPNIKPSTYTSYETYIRAHIKPFFNKIRLQELKPDLIQKFFNHKLENGRLDGKPGGISPKTLLNMKNMMHASLHQAQINGLISSNVIDLVKSPKQIKIEMRVLSTEEQAKITLAANENRFGLPIILALYTGMRIGEVLSLKLDDVNITGHKPIIHVRTSIRRENRHGNISLEDEIIGDDANCKTVLLRGSTKTYSSRRTIPLIPEAVEVIEKQLSHIEYDKNLACEGYNNMGFLFANALGMPFDQRTYQDIFNKIIQAAGVEKTIKIGTREESVGFHTLRHTFATRAIENGMDILVLSKILGHAQPSTTLNKYGHVLPDHKRQSMEKIRPSIIK